MPFLLPLAAIKYTIDKIRRIPAKIKNVTDVPTAGMVTKVGIKVPIMLPMVLNAPNVPDILPLSSRLFTVYLINDGVTVPSKKRGNTNIIIHAANAAHIRKLLFKEKSSKADIPIIIYLPATGIIAIQTDDIIILPYNLSGLGFLSAYLPPYILPSAIAIIIVPIMIVHTI